MKSVGNHRAIWLFILFVAFHGSGVNAAVYRQLGPMLGHVGPNEASIWAKASGATTMSVRIGLTEDLSDSRVVEGPALTSQTDYAGAVRITDLQPRTHYFYVVLFNDVATRFGPPSEFVTAPANGAHNHTRFAFGSCVGHYGFESAAAFADLAARTNIDFMLMLGDNHYADSTDPQKQREGYYLHRRQAGFRELSRRTPIYGIWDDHDFATNDSDGTVKGKETVLRTFKEFWANPAYGQPNDPGVYFKFSWGDLDFFMLDGRYHRSPNAERDTGHKTMLGPAQLDWLERELLAAKGTVKFLVSGGEWETYSHKDSWASFLRERNEIFKFIDDNRISGVVLLSGDRHFTGAYQVRGRFVEVTSGPLGSTNARTSITPEMFFTHNEGKMYCIFDVDTTAAKPALTLEVYKAAAGLIWRRPFTWEEITGVKKIPPLPGEGPATAPKAKKKP